ncbi:hypothetical protein [Flyfo siphovirus Tbat2_3]|nr:hypothetical protein [Flyfo siphovirus Tbat2_3]
MKLNIPIGNYIVTGNQYDLVLSEKRISTKDGVSKEVIARLGYYSKFEHLVKELCHREILASEAQSLSELVNHIDQLSKTVHKSISDYIEAANAQLLTQ